MTTHSKYKFCLVPFTVPDTKKIKSPDSASRPYIPKTFKSKHTLKLQKALCKHSFIKTIFQKYMHITLYLHSIDISVTRIDDIIIDLFINKHNYDTMAYHTTHQHESITKPNNFVLHGVHTTNLIFLTCTACHTLNTSFVSYASPNIRTNQILYKITQFTAPNFFIQKKSDHELLNNYASTHSYILHNYMDAGQQNHFTQKSSPVVSTWRLMMSLS